MANLPVRGLGGVGVITDVNPYDLPQNAFSDARNVIFDEGKVSRAPVFKKIFPLSNFGTNETRFVSYYSDPTAGQAAIICDRDGTVRTYPNGNATIVTPLLGARITNDEAWCHAQVSGISVLSRAGMVPYGRNLVSDNTYAYFPAGKWPNTDTCAVVRAYLDFMIALNVTKNTVEYPTMVKWSNPIPYGSPLADVVWDPANPENTAGENILGELTTPIIDGLALGSVFIIYSATQVYLMEYTGSSFVFNFRRLFSTGGVLGTNCVVEIEGKHYVFGEDDIYVHDGASKQSLANGRVRRAIYSDLLKDERSKCFVVHDSVKNHIYFCYKSRREDAAFRNTQFANKAAVYNYREDTWSFMDLPNVVGAAELTYDTSAQAYGDVTEGYDLAGASYSSFVADSIKIPTMMGVADAGIGTTQTRLYALDATDNPRVTEIAEPEVLVDAYVERIGLDLDEGGTELRTYKTVKQLIPQAEFQGSQGTMVWQVGSNDLPGQNVSWGPLVTFNSTTQYKVDVKASGRYLAYKVIVDSPEHFTLSGFDAEVISISRR